MSVVHLIAECLSAKICCNGNQIISFQRTALFFYGFLFRQTTAIESKGIGRVKMALLPPHFHDPEYGPSRRRSFPDEERRSSLVPLRTSVMSRDSLGRPRKRYLKTPYSWNIVSFAENRQWIEVSGFLSPTRIESFWWQLLNSYRLYVERKYSIAAPSNIPIIPENGPAERRGGASFMAIKKAPQSSLNADFEMPSS